MLEILKRIFAGQHQFATDGILLMIFGGLGVYLRAIPNRMLAWFIDQTTMSLTVKDDDCAFVWVKEWFLMQKFTRRIRRVDVDTSLRGERAAFVPAPGRHWFWHSGRPFTVTFYRADETKATRRYELFHFVTIGRKQMFLRKLVKEIVDCHERHFARKSAVYIYDEYWQRVEAYKPRLLDSVILKPGEKTHLIRDIEKFKANRIRYNTLGVPYHRGYLFYGLPGTGKTSVVSALAQHFSMSIYLLNLTELNDKTLVQAMNDVMPGSIVLFEDIDCMRSGQAGSGSRNSSAGANRDLVTTPIDGAAQVEGRSVTLSGLLNVLDGLRAPDNVLFVMTTNRIEALDAALMRPGRIDYKLYFGDASEEQKVELYRRFFSDVSQDEALSFVREHVNVQTMAEFQGLLLQTEEKRLRPKEYLMLGLPDTVKPSLSVKKL
jgi:mitochondrial chaperone BCS1